MHPIALSCTAILATLVFGLGLAISGQRFRSGRLAGCPEDPSDLLHKLIRAHANTAEYAAILAVLFLYFGANQPSPIEVALIVTATTARVVLVLGLTAWPRLDKPNPFRFLGAIGTYLAGLALCACLVIRLAN